MKTKIITIAIVVAIILGVLAYLNFVPFWVSISTTVSFIIGIFIGWYGKKWSDEHVK